MSTSHFCPLEFRYFYPLSLHCPFFHEVCGDSCSRFKPPHFTAFHHLHHFAWVKFQAIPSKIPHVIGPSSSKQARRHGGAFRGCAPQITACAPQTRSMPPMQGLCPVNGQNDGLFFSSLPKMKVKFICAPKHFFCPLPQSRYSGAGPGSK